MINATMRRRGRLLVLLCAVGACRDDGPGANNGNGAGNFAATIDGAAWTGANASAIAAAGGIFVLTGVQNGSGTALSMTLYSIGAPGTYPLGVGPAVPGGIAVIASGASSWSTPLSGAAGSVTVTAVSSSRIAGTFSFTAPPVLGQTAATRAVTQGRFDLAVTGPPTLVVPENAGSKVNGTLAGTAFNAATVATVTSPQSGTFTFAGSNTGYTLNVILSAYTGVGTYTLGTGAARTVSVTRPQAPIASWGGSNATTTGTLIVTSATSARVKGTISATLQPSPGFTGAPVIVSVAFDIGVP